MDAFWLYSTSQGPAKVSVLGTRAVPGGSAWVLESKQADGSRSEKLYSTSDSSVRYLATQDPDGRTRALGDFDIVRVGVDTEWRRYAVNFNNFSDFDGDGLFDPLAVRSVATVMSPEPVQTPIGTFAALHIRTTDTNVATLSRTGQQITQTTVSDDWYAAGVGLVRNVTTSSVDGRPVSSTESLITGYRVGTRRSDTTPPQVAERQPAPGAVAARAVVRVGFNEAMDIGRADPAAVVVSDPSGQPVPGTLRWASDRVLEFEPARALSTGRHRVTVAASAADIYGNAMAQPDSWVFDIDATGPMSVGSTPTQDARDVARDARLTIRFDEPLASLPAGSTTVTLQDEQGAVAVDVAVVGSELQVVPRRLLSLGQRHVLRVEAGLKDLLGNAGPGFEISFFSDSGRFELPALLPGVRGALDARVLDVDGDGRAEVLAVAGSPTDAAVSNLLLWRRSGVALSQPERVPTASGCAVSEFAVADVDGDGRLDLIVSYDACVAEWLAQDASGRFTRAGSIGTGRLSATAPLKIAATGQTAVVAGDDNGRTVVLRRQPNGSFALTDVLLVPGDQRGGMTVLDTDGDGLQDIVMLASLDSGLQGHLVWRQSADGTFAAPALLSRQPAGPVPGFRVVDVDGDGRDDLLFVTSTSTGGSAVGWMLRQTDGSLAPPVLLPTPAACVAVVAGDFNGDGLPDLATVHLGIGHTLAVHLRQPGGAYAPPELHSTSASTAFLRPPAVAVGDATGDGRADLVIFGVLRQQRITASGNAQPSSLGAAHPLGLPAPAASGWLGHGHRVDSGAGRR